MEYAYEICKAIEQYNKKDISATLEMLSELYKNTKIEMLQTRTLEICKENERCPICFEEFNISSHEEYRDRDLRYKETVYDRKCNYCGYYN